MLMRETFYHATGCHFCIWQPAVGDKSKYFHICISYNKMFIVQIMYNGLQELPKSLVFHRVYINRKSLIAI